MASCKLYEPTYPITNKYIEDKCAEATAKVKKLQETVEQYNRDATTINDIVDLYPEMAEYRIDLIDEKYTKVPADQQFNNSFSDLSSLKTDTGGTLDKITALDLENSDVSFDDTAAAADFLKIQDLLKKQGTMWGHGRELNRLWTKFDEYAREIAKLQEEDVNAVGAAGQ